MSSFGFLLLCIQACLIQNAFANSGCGAAKADLGLRWPGGCGYGAGQSGYGAGLAGYGAGLAGYGLAGQSAGYGAAYGGSGMGNVAIAGELPVGGSTAVSGQVPIIGVVEYAGPVAATGAITITGHCPQHCGCEGVYY